MSRSEIFISAELRPDVSPRDHLEPVDIADLIARDADFVRLEETGKELSEPGPDPETGKEASEPEPTGKEQSEVEPADEPDAEPDYPDERTARHEIRRPIM